MSRYEVAFPVNPPVQAFLDVAKSVSSGDVGGGQIALPAWVAGGYACRIVFGDGESTGPTPFGARPQSDAAMSAAASQLSPAQVEELQSAYIQVFGNAPKHQPQLVDGRVVVGSDLSVWLRSVVVPLAIRGLQMAIDALTRYVEQ